MRLGLVALLAAETTVTDLVSSRIYADNAPQKADFPHIVITQMGSEDFKTLDGTGELRAIDFDIDCKADRAVESYALGNAVREYIKDYSGTAGDQTIGAVLLNDESAEIEPPRDGSDISIYNTLLDVTIQYIPA